MITPSHNPPDDGGFKYDPPHGGPSRLEHDDHLDRIESQRIPREEVWRA